MPARPGLTPELVVTAALEIVDESGPDALTLARVAVRTRVAAPSLYKHVAGFAELRRLLRLRVLTEMDQALRGATVGRAGEDALRALAAAYRDYLRRHPHRHEFIEPAPGADPAVQAAADRLVDVAYAVVRGYGLTGPATVHAVRCLRATVHGFARLEASGEFGLAEEPDTSFTQLLDMLDRGMRAMAVRSGG